MSTTVNFEKISNLAIFYADLGPKGRKVLEILDWYIKKFPLAYPSQSKIAKMAKCTRAWVNTIIKRAAKAGIVLKLKRAYSTCRYLYEDWLKSLTVKDIANKYLEMTKSLNREFTVQFTKELTIVCSNSYYSQENKISKGETCTSVQNREFWNGKDFPYHLLNLPISDQTKAKLSCFPQADFECAKESLDYRKSKGKGLKSQKAIEDYAISTCIRRAKERREKINWRPYYDWLKRYGI